MVFAVGLLSAEARAADVRININFGQPPVVYHAPPVVYHAPPRLVYLPEPAVYVAVGVPHDIFFVGGRYYNYRGGSGFHAPSYGAPWVSVRASALPYGLRHYSVARLHDYRDREYNRIYVDNGRNRRADVVYANNGKGKARGNKHGRR
jgi:hypothetical protein